MCVYIHIGTFKRQVLSKNKVALDLPTDWFETEWVSGQLLSISASLLEISSGWFSKACVAGAGGTACSHCEMWSPCLDTIKPYFVEEGMDPETVVVELSRRCYTDRLVNHSWTWSVFIGNTMAAFPAIKISFEESGTFFFSHLLLSEKVPRRLSSLLLSARLSPTFAFSSSLGEVQQPGLAFLLHETVTRSRCEIKTLRQAHWHMMTGLGRSPKKTYVLMTHLQGSSRTAECGN